MEGETYFAQKLERSSAQRQVVLSLSTASAPGVSMELAMEWKSASSTYTQKTRKTEAPAAHTPTFIRSARNARMK